MDEDDDMIMIIVGDEAEKTLPNPIKNEPANTSEINDESTIDLESLMRNAKSHGEYIDLVSNSEKNSDESDLEEYNDDNTEVTIERIDAEYLSSGDESDRRRHKLKTKVSYVAQLQNNFPKMKRDEEYLVSHLTEMMKQIKPPPPPIGFCQNSDGRLVCSYCNAVSMTLPIAGRHYQKKHGTRYLICYACGADFRCTTGLYKHEKRCPAEGARIVLMARGRYLGRKGRQRPYLTLGKFDPGDLIRKKKRYHCKKCEQDFPKKDRYIAHMKLHQGIQPFKCNKCHLTFASTVLLKKHNVVYHADERHFTCDTCGHSFKTKSTLITHMNTHLPERKYPCDRCDRRFAQKQALLTHINRDHLNRPHPYACSECPRRFPRLFNLKWHLKTKHGMTLMTRQNFLKALPTMKEDELRQATIVFNNAKSDEINKLSNTAIKTKHVNTSKEKSDHVCLDITYRTEEMPKVVKRGENIKDPYLDTLEYGVHDEKEDDNLEEDIVEKKDTTLEDYLSSIVKVQKVVNLIDIKILNNAGAEEEILGTPNDAFIRKIVPENGEIEFARLCEQTGESIVNKTERELSPTLTDDNTIDDIKHESGETANNIKIKTDNSPEINYQSKDSVTALVQIAPYIKKECKKSETPNKRISFARKTIGTRSAAMKTRSGMKIFAKENMINTRSKN